MRTREIKRVLVIRFRRVGDAVISSAICSSIKKSFPSAEVDYVLNENISALFETHPDIDRLISFTEKEMHNYCKYLVKVFNIVRKGKYDVIIDTRSTVKTLWFSLFSPFTPYRIGHKKNYNFFLHNYRLPSGKRETEGEFLYMLELLKPLERKYEIRYSEDFKIYVGKEEREEMRSDMIRHGISFDRPVIFCSVAARDTRKAWQPEKMTEVLKLVLERYPNVQMVFNYSGEEERSAAEFIADSICDKRVFIDIRADNLRELSALISNSDFLFGNEGGARHIAQALGIPSFAIYSPYAPKSVWLPLPSEKYGGIEYRDVLENCREEEGLSYEEKFDLIDVDSVWNGLSKMLDDYLKK